jgi:transcriptional regulator with XRE-family HTH domain
MELKSFGQRIRDRRVEEGWSQEDLARKADISRNYLSQIERGVATNLSWQVRKRLVTVLGLRTPEIFEEQWSQSNLPPGLPEFARKVNLPAGDVEMLAQIQLRGKQPSTPEEWELLYKAIRIALEET